MKITMEFHASELNAAMLAALNVLLVEDKREELRGLDGLDGADEGVAELPGDGAAFAEVWGVPTDGPLTASELREQTIAAAVAQDGADARVVSDWRPYVCPDLAPSLPIRRQDVVLQVGDKVTFRSGEAGTVTEAHQFGGQPIWADIGDGRNSCFTLDGFYWKTKNESSSDIVSVNGRPIIED